MNEEKKYVSFEKWWSLSRLYCKLEEGEARFVSMAIKNTLSLYEFIAYHTKCMHNSTESPEKWFYRLSDSGVRPACLSFDLVQQIQVRLDAVASNIQWLKILWQANFYLSIKAHQIAVLCVTVCMIFLYLCRKYFVLFSNSKNTL